MVWIERWEDLTDQEQTELLLQHFCNKMEEYRLNLFEKLTGLKMLGDLK